jgi:hypothetical protein
MQPLDWGGDDLVNVDLDVPAGDSACPLDGLVGVRCKDRREEPVALLDPPRGPGPFHHNHHLTIVIAGLTLDGKDERSVNGKGMSPPTPDQFVYNSTVPSLSLRLRSAISASSDGNINAMPRRIAFSCTSSTKGRSLSWYS